MLAINPTEFECPFCHHNGFGIAPIGVLSAIKTGGLRRRVLDMMVQAYPEGVSMRQLEIEIYGHTKDGGPLSATVIISNRICELRHMLAEYGWSIPRRERAHTYRLTPTVYEGKP